MAKAGEIERNMRRQRWAYGGILAGSLLAEHVGFSNIPLVPLLEGLAPGIPWIIPVIVFGLIAGSTIGLIQSSRRLGQEMGPFRR